MGEDPSHAAYFRQIEILHNRERAELPAGLLEEAWQHYRQRLPLSPAGGRFGRWQKIGWAASVLLLIGLAWFLAREERIETSRFVSQQIHPGEKKAILELPGGQVYHLGRQPHVLSGGVGGRITADSLQVLYSATEAVAREPELHKLYVPRGGEFRLELEDGSRVWVNSDTRLHYPVPFDAGFREICLEGEAWFEVAPDTERPFVVRSGEQKITVLGTSFGITSYASESTVSTTLVEGKVRVSYLDDDREWLLEPGTHITYDRSTREVVQTREEIEQYIAWTQGKYIFRIRRLEEMLTTLSRWYDFEVTYLEPEVKDILFSGELRRFDDFRHILNIIERSGDARFQIEGSHIKVYKNKTEG